jgi:hypothetical protein
VHDAAFMRGLERCRHVDAEPQRIGLGQRTTLEARRERFAFDQLEHEVRSARRVFEPVDRGDVRMVQRRERLRFAPEPGEALGVGGECGG